MGESTLYKAGFTGDSAALEGAIGLALASDGKPELAKGAFAAFKEGRTDALRMMTNDCDTLDSVLDVLRKAPEKDLAENCRKLAGSMSAYELKSTIGMLSFNDTPDKTESMLVSTMNERIEVLDAAARQGPFKTVSPVRQEFSQMKARNPNAVARMQKKQMEMQMAVLMSKSGSRSPA